MRVGVAPMGRTLRVALRPPEERELRISAAAAGDMLRCTPRALALLLSGGYLPLTQSAVRTLATRPHIEVLDGALPVVRLGPERLDGARPIGARAAMLDDELVEATSGWWACNPAEVIEAGLLGVAVSSFVVAVLRVDKAAGYRHMDVPARSTVVRRYWFAARLWGRIDDLLEPATIRWLEPSTRQVADLLGNRVPSPRGAPLVVLRASAAKDGPAAGAEGRAAGLIPE